MPIMSFIQVRGQGIEKGWPIIEALNEVIDENNNITILLEGMSGKELK